MNLILYPSGEAAFENNGLGILKDVLDDEVHEVLNGQFELTFRYPASGRLFRDLVIGAYVTAKPNPLSGPQPFRIYRVSKVRNGWATVNAQHISYNLKKYACSTMAFDPAPVNTWLPQIAEHIYPASPFVFETDIAGIGGFSSNVPRIAWKLLGSEEGCLRAEGHLKAAECEFDGYRVIFHSRRGADRGVRIRYGRNLRDLTLERKQGDRVTAVYPYCTDENGVCYELPEGYVANPNLAEGEEIFVYVADCGKAEEMPEAAGTIEAWLRVAAWWCIMALNDGGNGDNWVETSLQIDFIRLSETEDYKDRDIPDEVVLGDTVYVEDPELGVSVSARVSEMRYQPIRERIKGITVGNVRRNIVHTIARRTTRPELKIQVDASAADGILQAAL